MYESLISMYEDVGIFCVVKPEEWVPRVSQTVGFCGTTIRQYYYILIWGYVTKGEAPASHTGTDSTLPFLPHPRRAMYL
jgi:hypothetical protein